MFGHIRSVLYFVFGASLLLVSGCGTPPATSPPEPTSLPIPTATTEPVKPEKPELLMTLTGDETPFDMPYGVAVAPDDSSMFLTAATIVF